MGKRIDIFTDGAEHYEVQICGVPVHIHSGANPVSGESGPSMTTTDTSADVQDPASHIFKPSDLEKFLAARLWRSEWGDMPEELHAYMAGADEQADPGDSGRNPDIPDWQAEDQDGR